MPLFLLIAGLGGALWYTLRRGNPSADPNSSGATVPPPVAPSISPAMLSPITSKPSLSTGYAGQVSCAAANVWFSQANAAVKGVIPVSEWNKLTCSQKQQIMLEGPLSVNTLFLQYLASTPQGQEAAKALAQLNASVNDTAAQAQAAAGHAGGQVSKIGKKLGL